MNQEIINRLARRYLAPEMEQALRVSSTVKVEKAIQDRIATGAFKGALTDVVQSSKARNPDYKDMAESFQDALEEALIATAKRLANLCAERMDRLMPSGSKAPVINGTENQDWEGTTYTNWEITVPQSVVGRKAIRSKLAKLVPLVMENLWVKRMKLDPKAVVRFFKTPAVERWIDKQWSVLVRQYVDETKVPLTLFNSATETALEGTEDELRCTRYTDIGEEDLPCGLLEYDVYVEDPVWEVLKAEIKSGHLVLALKLTFSVTGPYKVELS